VSPFNSDCERPPSISISVALPQRILTSALLNAVFLYDLFALHSELWDLFHETNSRNGRQGEAPLIRFRSHAKVSRLRRVCSSRMMLMKKYGNAISQERIVGNSGLKEPFLYITR
jgi:hypothetical protein